MSLALPGGAGGRCAELCNRFPVYVRSGRVAKTPLLRAPSCSCACSACREVCQHHRYHMFVPAAWCAGVATGVPAPTVASCRATGEARTSNGGVLFEVLCSRINWCKTSLNAQ
eukprot:scaffold7233_cov570-Prasinococcus_capsulatus_cf.AAC.6